MDTFGYNAVLVSLATDLRAEVAEAEYLIGDDEWTTPGETMEFDALSAELFQVVDLLKTRGVCVL